MRENLLPAAKKRSRRSSDVSIVRVSPSRRIASLLSILPITSTQVDDNVRELDVNRIYRELSGWIAWYHLTNPSEHIIPGIGERLSSCDIDFSYDMHDSQFQDRIGAGDLLGRMMMSSNITTKPVAIVGAARSSVSGAVSSIASAFEIPQVSPSSTSSHLENKENYPYFARTVPSNAGDAKALALYFQALGVTHINVVYAQNSYGLAYLDDIRLQTASLGIDTASFPFQNSRESMKSAMISVQESGRKYVVAIVDETTMRELVRAAKEEGVMGNELYSWTLTQLSVHLVGPEFSLDRETEADIAVALDGVGILSIDLPVYKPFDKVLETFSTDRSMQNMYIEQHSEQQVRGLLKNFEFSTPMTQSYNYLAYDAVIALAVAACESTHDTFTGPQLFDQLRRTKFHGTSGFVSFDRMTGSRLEETVNYRIQNLVLQDSETGPISLSTPTSSLINVQNKTVTISEQFLFWGKNPQSLPVFEELVVDQNLIPTGIRAFGLGLGGTVMLTCIYWIMWTIRYRDRDVVRAAQPVFLIQLALGALIMTSAVIPMSLQEPASQRSLDIACMTSPWLISIGFVTSFSALFSKGCRLNRIIQSGKTMRRIVVRPRDVMLPFLVLMSINIVFLICWTIFSPYRWVRAPEANFDQFGRSVESYGSCQYSNGKGRWFLAPIVAVNLAALVFANYQSWLGRRLPTDFSESFFVTISMASLLESLILGIPLLMLAQDTPPTRFLIQSILTSIMALAILLPIFIPKLTQSRDVEDSNINRQEGPQSISRRPSRIILAVNGDDVHSVNQFMPEIMEAETEDRRRGESRLTRKGVASRRASHQFDTSPNGSGDFTRYATPLSVPHSANFNA